MLAQLCLRSRKVFSSGLSVLRLLSVLILSSCKVEGPRFPGAPLSCFCLCPRAGKLRNSHLLVACGFIRAPGVCSAGNGLANHTGGLSPSLRGLLDLARAPANEKGLPPEPAGFSFIGVCLRADARRFRLASFCLGAAVSPPRLRVFSAVMEAHGCPVPQDGLPDGPVHFLVGTAAEELKKSMSTSLSTLSASWWVMRDSPGLPGGRSRSSRIRPRRRCLPRSWVCLVPGGRGHAVEYRVLRRHCPVFARLGP